MLTQTASQELSNIQGASPVLLFSPCSENDGLSKEGWQDFFEGEWRAPIDTLRRISGGELASYLCVAAADRHSPESAFIDLM